MQSADLAVYDISGKKLIQQTLINNAGDSTIELDNKLPSGIYIFRLTGVDFNHQELITI
jgi:hypothetical protein